MYFPFQCKNCEKDKWTIRFDSENKVHILQCANCGDVEILEDVFSSRRRKKNAIKKDIKKKLIGAKPVSKETITTRETFNEVGSKGEEKKSQENTES